MNIIGDYLNNEEIDELISYLNKKERFLRLVEEIKQYTKFDLNKDKLKVVQGIKFDIQYDIDKGEPISVRSLRLQASENVEFMYLERFKNHEDKNKKEMFNGTITEKINNTKIALTSFTSIDDNNVKVVNNEYSMQEIKMQLNNEEKEEVIYNISEKYYPGILNNEKQGKIQPQGFWEGCLPGGYIYCGVKCGGSIACKRNSRSGINGLDNCCKTHDCCYTQRGVKFPDTYCDSRLCGCAAAAPKAKSTPIVMAVMCYINK